MVFVTFGGFAAVPLHVNLMQAIGWVMIALFFWLFHGPWLAFKRAVDPRIGPPPQPASIASAGSSRSTFRWAWSLL